VQVLHLSTGYSDLDLKEEKRKVSVSIVGLIMGGLKLFKEELMSFIRKVIKMLSDRSKRRKDNKKVKQHFDELETITLSFETLFNSTQNPFLKLLR